MRKHVHHSLMLAVLFCASALGITTDTNLWINEFHYDNTGADAGEFVEVIVPANFTHLSEVTVTLYNGANGQSYASHSLDTFTQGVTANGFTVYSRAIAPIQNGSPDGISLDIDGNVLSFVSYEGSFSATNGVANGLASTNISVSESSGTPVGSSVQLTGAGNSFGDFSGFATTAGSNTQGAVNASQSIPSQPRGKIAADDFDSSISLLSFALVPPSGTITDPADGFDIFQRGVSPTIPFALLDDSAGSFPPDVQGVIKTGKSDRWLGLADTDNSDNPGGAVSATWVFDISGHEGIEVSIDMAAMGDFESSDVFNWFYSIDGAALLPLFLSSVDENGTNSYTMEGGAVVAVNDPLYVNGILIDNNFKTLTESVIGTGSLLTLVFQGDTNGSNEAYAFDNIMITALIPEPTTAMLGFLALGGLLIQTRRRD